MTAPTDRAFPEETKASTMACRLLSVTLYGMHPWEAGETQLHWRGHLAHVHHESGLVGLVLATVTSGFANLGWRLWFGPPSALLPGVALVATGIATAIMAVVGAGNPLPNIAVTIAAVTLGSVLVKHPRVQPRVPLAIGCALVVPVLLAYAVSIAIDIWQPSDWFIVAGSTIIAVGCGLVCLGASGLRAVDLQVGRSWGFGLCAVGAGSIAVAELDWILRSSGFGYFVARSIAAIGMLAIAFTAWRIREVDQTPEQDFDLDALLDEANA